MTIRSTDILSRPLMLTLLPHVLIGEAVRPPTGLLHTGSNANCKQGGSKRGGLNVLSDKRGPGRKLERIEAWRNVTRLVGRRAAKQVCSTSVLPSYAIIWLFLAPVTELMVVPGNSHSERFSTIKLAVIKYNICSYNINYETKLANYIKN